MWIYRRVLKISWMEKITNEVIGKNGNRQRNSAIIQDEEITMSRTSYMT